jgi:hypothetical protein
MSDILADHPEPVDLSEIRAPLTPNRRRLRQKGGPRRPMISGAYLKAQDSQLIETSFGYYVQLGAELAAFPKPRRVGTSIEGLSPSKPWLPKDLPR